MQTATNLQFILRDLAQQRATGRLLVKLPGTLATIYLSVGKIVHATLGIRKGTEALSMILRTTPESSEFRANLSAPETTIQGSLESLLGNVPGPLSSVQPTQTVPPTPQSVPASLMSDLARVLVEVVGPIGSIILDDALAELNVEGSVPQQALQPLIVQIIKHLKPSARQPFQHKVSGLLDRYGFR